MATLESCLLYDPIARLVPQPRQKEAVLEIATHSAWIAGRCDSLHGCVDRCEKGVVADYNLS